MYTESLSMKNKFMNHETIIKTIKSFINVNQKKGDYFLRVHLFGGEPLINKAEIYKAIKLLKNAYKKTKIEWVLNTNGSLIAKEDADFFRNYDVQVNVSCDGFASTHDKNRVNHKGEGTHSCVEKALKNLRKYSVNTQINSFVNPNNINKETIPAFTSAELIGSLTISLSKIAK